MSFRKVNNIAGWIVFVIASLVFILTSEQRGSFWDCGEFVSACYKVQLPHPPGAPLFILLGRFFVILFGDDPMTAAKAVNIMNALASGATVLFLFWSITHFARKLLVGLRTEPDMQQVYTIVGAGIVGGLAYTFSDSFWFSAVEGEVYALSSLFTALAFWAVLKWERADDAAGNNPVLRNRADRWIVFLFFSLGLSIGVHLLGILVIPAAVMVYYYKRYTYTRKGAIWAFIIGCLVTGVVQVVVIKWTVLIAGKFDIFFVNGFGMPFFSGFAIFFILLGLLVWLGLRVADKNNWSFLRLGLWCFAFMMIGYSTYITTLERSNANPAMDMNNVDNPMSLVYYLGREQYGSQPILTGPHFAAPVKRDERGQLILKEGKKRYAKGDGRYIELPREMEYSYYNEDVQLFPRVWDPSNDQNHADFYKQWLNLDEFRARAPGLVAQVDYDNNIIYTVVDRQGTRGETYTLPDGYRPKVAPGQQIDNGTPIAQQAPSYLDNIQWFMTYQMGFMYWRYFMWNFSGKQNDLQGFGNKRDGNWISGISVIDNARLGDQSAMPDSINEGKGTNKLFLLPFILGIIGCVFHFMRDRKDWIVTFLLFFMTGVAIVVYLNQAGNQPRERDYAFAGSFYAYAIWIGLSVVGFVRMALEKNEKQAFTNNILYSSLATLLVMLMSDANNMHGGTVLAAVVGALLTAAIAAIFTLVVRSVAGKTNNIRMGGLVATLLCLIAPVIMASEEWNDHDRSKKLLAPEMARNYLDACPKDAILFTFGDNDTYPLWYAQEVEGVRPDVRIVNTSLLGIDWYVNQLRYKVNESAPIDVIWSADQVRNLQVIYNGTRGDESFAPTRLDSFMKNSVGPLLHGEDKSQIVVNFPMQLTIPVDTAFVRTSGLVNASDIVLPQFTLEISPNKNMFTLDQLTILNVLATTQWKRPICFTSPAVDFLVPYMRQEGIIYRVVPTASRPSAQLDVLKTASILPGFQAGNAEIPGVYFDEENRRQLISIRETFAETASGLVDLGKSKEAIDLLNRSVSLMDTINMPYGKVSRFNQHNRASVKMWEAAYKAGHKELAEQIKAPLLRDLNQQLNYYASAGDMTRAELDNILNQYVKTMETTGDPNQADNFLYSSLDDRQKGFFTDIKSSFEFTKFIANRSAVVLPPTINELIPQAADSAGRDSN